MNFVGIVCIFLIGSCLAENVGDGPIINGENVTDISPITEVSSNPEPTVTIITSSQSPVTSTTTTPKTSLTTSTATSVKTSTSATTIITKSTSSTKSPLTSTSIAPNVTKSPDPTPVPSKDRGFSGPSFVGGIVLTLGLMAIGFIGFKLNRRRQEGQNYHTL